MVAYSDKNAFALFGVETTFNTAASSINKDIGTVNDLGVEHNNNLNPVYEIGNRESTDLEVGNYDTTISIDGNLNSGALFELMFGQCTDAQSGATSDYRHYFIDVGDANGAGALTLPDTASSFSILENYSSSSDITFSHTGCKVNSIDINFETGGLFEYSTEILGSAVDTGTSAGTQVTTTTSKLSAYHATISTGDDGSEATVTKVKSATVNMSQNIDPADVKAIGSRENQDLVEKNFDVTVEFTAVFDSKTEEERFLGGTSPSTGTPTDTTLILDVNNGVALGSGRIDFYLRLKKGQYGTVNRRVAQNGIVERTFNYTAGNINDLYFTDQVTTYF